MNDTQLESKWEQPMNLRNHVEINVDDTRTTFYIGKAWLEFQGLDIWGQAQLTRVDRTTRIEQIKKIVSIIPWRYTAAPKSFNDDRTVWDIEGSRHQCFLSDGKTKNGYERSWDYRADLRSKAMNMGLDLSAELFDRVFNPIDAQILQLYERAKQYASLAGGNK